MLLLEETGRVGAARSDRRDGGGGRAAAGRGRRRPSCSSSGCRRWPAATSLVTTAFGGRARAQRRRGRSRAGSSATGGWSRCRPTCAELERQPSVDGSRRLFAVDVGRRPRRSCWPRATTRRPRVDRALDRGALGTAAQLVGLGRPDARPHRRLREGAPAVRRADRLVPGGQAPPGRRAARTSSSPVPVVLRARPTRWPPAIPTRPRDVSMAKAARRDAAAPGRPPGAAVPRRHRLHRRVRPAPLLKRVWALAASLGRCRPATAAGSPIWCSAQYRPSRSTDRPSDSTHPTTGAHHGRGLHHRRRSHAGRQAGRRPEPGAPGRPRAPSRSSS